MNENTNTTLENEQGKKIQGTKGKKSNKALKISSLVIVSCILLGLLGYFVVYPFIAVLTGNYYVYIRMYNVKEYKVPNGVTSIDSYAFVESPSLESVIIPDSVITIENSAFYRCTGLKSATIPDGVTVIENCVFDSCKNLTSVTIPKSVTTIKSSVFWGCEKLESIHFKGTMSEWNAISKGDKWDRLTGNYTVYCTDGTIEK